MDEMLYMLVIVAVKTYSTLSAYQTIHEENTKS